MQVEKKEADIYAQHEQWAVKNVKRLVVFLGLLLFAILYGMLK